MARRTTGRKTRFKANRTRRPRSHIVPCLRVSAVWERNVRMRQRPDVKTSADLAVVLASTFPEEPDGRERFVMAMMDVRYRLIGVHTVSIGCLTGTIVHPREILRMATVAGAAHIGVGHNHPSGDPEPSQEDVKLTRRLMAVSSMIGIELLDHIVFGEGMGWVSMRERQLMALCAPCPSCSWTANVSALPPPAPAPVSTSVAPVDVAHCARPAAPASNPARDKGSAARRKTR